MSRTTASMGGALAVLTASQWAAAANICNQVVPENRSIDGIPAYDQCTDSTNSAVYSNNGVDTSTTATSADWVRTQWSGGYQCTELASRYLRFRWNVQSVPKGNAGTWCDGTLPSGLVKTASPTHGDLIVFAPGSCGADATTGHVAVVDVVNTDATVTFVEQNRAGRRKCASSTAACFLHASANNGAAGDGGVAPDVARDATSASEDAARDATSASEDAAVPTDVRRPNDAIDRPDRMPPRTDANGGAGGGVAAVDAGGGSSGAAGAGGASDRPDAMGANQDTGGTSASGGAGGSSATGGTLATGGADGSGPATAAKSSSGCSCELTRAPGRTNLWWVLALIPIVRRRRRS